MAPVVAPAPIRALGVCLAPAQEKASVHQVLMPTKAAVTVVLRPVPVRTRALGQNGEPAPIKVCVRQTQWQIRNAGTVVIKPVHAQVNAHGPPGVPALDKGHARPEPWGYKVVVTVGLNPELARVHAPGRLGVAAVMKVNAKQEPLKAKPVATAVIKPALARRAASGERGAAARTRVNVWQVQSKAPVAAIVGRPIVIARSETVHGPIGNPVAVKVNVAQVASRLRGAGIVVAKLEAVATPAVGIPGEAVRVKVSAHQTTRIPRLSPAANAELEAVHVRAAEAVAGVIGDLGPLVVTKVNAPLDP